MHLLCTEAYIVIAGSGSIQTLTWEHGFAETPLRTGTVVTFTPGTIHRLVNADGQLRIVVVMANNGLPEAGDAVFTFPSAVLADPSAYRRSAEAAGEQTARQRRDLALQGFRSLRHGGRTRLDQFHQQAAAIVAPRLGEFETRWREGAHALANTTGEQLARLHLGDHSHLRHASVSQLGSYEAIGMCGRLEKYDGLHGITAPIPLPSNESPG